MMSVGFSSEKINKKKLIQKTKRTKYSLISQ